MPKYRKKPVTVDAFCWTGDEPQSLLPDWIIERINTENIWFVDVMSHHVEMRIKTLEGLMTASRGDYIIKEVAGEIYPCKPDIFEKTYEVLP